MFQDVYKRFFPLLLEFCTFVFEGVGHIDNLQMREDAGRTQWNCAGFVYTRVSQFWKVPKSFLFIFAFRELCKWFTEQR